MEDTQNVSAEVTPAPEQELTAAPGPEVTPEPDQEEVKPAKTFTQEELDAAIGKRLAREQRKWEREQAARVADQAKLAPVTDLSLDQFESPEAYADALATRKADELARQREAQREKATLIETYHSREEEARDKYDDFEQVAYNPNLRITEVMAEAIQSSDLGPDVAYYLGSNPKEADRISRLSPLLQAKEIGKIEVKLTGNPAPKQTTSAPAPISPVNARASTNPGYDTTDPRSIKSMSTSEWIEAERQRQIRKYEAQRNR